MKGPFIFCPVTTAQSDSWGHSRAIPDYEKDEKTRTSTEKAKSKKVKFLNKNFKHGYCITAGTLIDTIDTKSPHLIIRYK
jgi:hypothetical protein